MSQRGEMLNTSDGDSSSPLETAHVLFLDLVGFSTLPTDIQRERVIQLQNIVCALNVVSQARRDGTIIFLPTGDGIALVFFHNVLSPVECAVELSAHLADQPHLLLRMGINSGPVQRMRDVNGGENITGPGINLAQRVMDCGHAGHILLSQSVAETLLGLSDWAACVHDVGVYRVKHGVAIHLYNLVLEGAGNNKPPKRRQYLLGFRATQLVAGLAVALCGISLAGVFWFRGRFAPSPVSKYVAVLPFENSPGKSNDQVLCDGLTERVSTSLAKYAGEDFWVAPASDIRLYGVKTAADALRTMGATVAVSGSMLRDGRGLQLTLKATDTASGRTLGVRTARGSDSELETFSGSALIELSEMLRISLNSGPTEAKRAAGAFQYFLAGEGHLHRFDGPRSTTEAISSFQHAIQLDQTFSEGFAGLAEAYFALFRDTKELRWLGSADEMARKAASLPNPGAQVHLTLGIIELETGHADAAIEQFRLALGIEPKNIEALRNLATAFEATGDKKRAEAAFQQAVRARPAYWPVHSSLAAFYASNGQYQKAKTEFITVTQLAPQNPLGYRNLGALYNLMGQHDEAITALRTSIQLRPTAAAYSNLGAVLFVTGQFVEASNAMLQATGLSDKDAMLHFNAADVLWLLPEKRDQAIMEYRRAAGLAQESLEVNPTDARIASMLAICLARLGDTAGALENVHHSLELAPGNPSVRFKAARVMAITGHKAEADQNLTAALTLGYPRDEPRIYPELSGLSLATIR